jgi:hypothetical protein
MKKILFAKKHQAFLDELLSQFGQISPNIQYEAIVNEKATIVKFSAETVKMFNMNSKQIKHRHLAALCKQLAKTAGVAKCGPEDVNVPERGLRLAKLKFSKIVARVIMGTQKQIHRDACKKLESFSNRVNAELVKINKKIDHYKGKDLGVA